MLINPFILTQIGGKQNELVLSTNRIDKAELSDYIYSFYEELNENTTFFRSFKMKENVVVAYYWKTNIPELESGRQGLYVIIGFVTDDCLNSVENFIWYTTNFFRILESTFKISLISENSDSFFEMLQTEPYEILDNIKERFIKLRATLAKTQYKKLFFILHFRPWKKEQIKHIYMLNDSPDFYKNWTAFIRESFFMLKSHFCWDVSTLKSFTPRSIIILENGSKISFAVTRAKAIHHDDANYILLR